MHHKKVSSSYVNLRWHDPLFVLANLSDEESVTLGFRSLFIYSPSGFAILLQGHICSVVWHPDFPLNAPLFSTKWYMLQVWEWYFHNLPDSYLYLKLITHLWSYSNISLCLQTFTPNTVRYLWDIIYLSQQARDLYIRIHSTCNSENSCTTK